MVWYVMLCRVVSCCVMTCHDILSYVISCHDVICYAVLWAVRADFLYVFRKSSRLHERIHGFLYILSAHGTIQTKTNKNQLKSTNQ